MQMKLLKLIENPTEDEKKFYQILVIKKILLIFIQMKTSNAKK